MAALVRVGDLRQHNWESNKARNNLFFLSHGVIGGILMIQSIYILNLSCFSQSICTSSPVLCILHSVSITIWSFFFLVTWTYRNFVPLLFPPPCESMQRREMKLVGIAPGVFHSGRGASNYSLLLTRNLTLQRIMTLVCSNGCDAMENGLDLDPMGDKQIRQRDHLVPLLFSKIAIDSSI